MPRKPKQKLARFQLFAVTAPDGRHRRMIAAESQREAAYRMGVSEHRLRHYGIDIGNADTRMMAHSSPGTVFESPCNADSWKAVLVQPYIRKHVAYAEPLRVTGGDPDALERFRQSLMLKPRDSHITTLIPESEAPIGDAIARSKRILALVDDYHERPTAATRSALRHALMAEFAPTPHRTKAALRAWLAAPCTADDLGPNDHAIGEPRAGMFDGVPFDALLVLWKAAIASLQPVSKKD